MLIGVTSWPRSISVNRSYIPVYKKLIANFDSYAVRGDPGMATQVGLLTRSLAEMQTAISNLLARLNPVTY